MHLLFGRKTMKGKGYPICVQCNFQDIGFVYTMIKKDYGICNLRHLAGTNLAVLLYHNK